MKVMLIKDVYNLGRAGEVKKVANGYARNFLIPQKMAVMATTGALKQVEKIQAAAAKQRQLLNEEMSGLAEQIAGLELPFKAKIGETGKLYGSVTQQMIIDAINEKLNSNLDKRLVESQPLREEGEHMVRVRLTFDLVPEVKVIVESDEEKEDEETDERKADKKAEAEPEAEPVAEEPAAEVEAQPEESSADESAEEA
jgi:large subunit ribosomal protein L9